MQTLSQFTNLYPVSKTLRFKLIPQGKTLEYIERRGLIQEDELRAEEYKKMKSTIDEYHKWFINHALNNVELTELNQYYQLYTSSPEKKKEERWKKEIEACQKALRKQVVAAFKSEESKSYFSKLFKKELIKELIPEWLANSNEETYYTEVFNNFTTYFTGFNENRQNMYSDEAKSTAISYRLIHENLPKYIDNILAFGKISDSDVSQYFSEVYSNFEAYLNVNSLEELFELNNYNEVLTQSQIDAYNLVIGGKSTDEKNRIQGLNEYINLYNQTHPDNKLPKLKMLYKQILSDREKISFLPETFLTVNELLESVNDFYQLKLSNEDDINVLEELQYLLKNLTSYDLEKIYIRNNRAITDLSQMIFGDYSVIRDSIEYAETLENGNRVKMTKKKPDYYSIGFLEECLNSYVKYLNAENETVTEPFLESQPIVSCLSSTLLFSQIQELYADYEDVATHLYGEKEKLNKADKNRLKEFLDKILELEHFVKPLLVTSDQYSDKDSNFYSSFEPLYYELESIIPLYNKVRNFMTQKPYSTEKFKLNFQSPTLLNGWDVNKETANLSVLLKKGEQYYLGIIDKRDTKAVERLSSSDDEDVFEKIEYKLLPGPNKMLPKVFFSKKNIDYYHPSEEILRIRKEETFKKGENFSLEDCHAFIDFYKESISRHPDWSQFGFEFSSTGEYEDISAFYKEVELQGYKITYKPISNQDITDLVNDGKLYLFQIYNKDFSSNSKGKPNLHTIYWRALFDEVNLEDVVYKLNGQAEIFYRKASISLDDAVVHPANQPISNKNPNNKKSESQFQYDIIKDRRYTMDQFQFHVPITMNFKAIGTTRLNQQVREYLKDNPNVNIIGIDRGERHLLYVSVINQHGEILKDENGQLLQKSLNEIVSSHSRNGKQIDVSTPYHDMLDEREKQRQKSRESWETIEGIKELKEGYLSQVVSIISRWMVEYNAIVVLEDLNMGFKRGRYRVEKQVYQKFEKMLIDKLNYLVFKDIPCDQPGGTYHAYQLTEAFTSFKTLGKQSGFLFYVPAWNTSKMDPVTGFVNLFPRVKTAGEKRAFYEKFDDISYDGENFTFSFDYDNFTNRYSASRRKWTMSTQGGTRYYWDRLENNGKGADKKIDLTESIANLLSGENIEYKSGRNLVNDIAGLQGNAMSKMMLYFNVLTKMRYSSATEKVDFILSPVANEQGLFFDSRNCRDTLPKDADANGAYNIARKGAWMINQIQQSEYVMDAKLAISNEEWLRYVQKV